MPELKLVIAEKPSVGMELARVLGCHGRRRGYMIGSGYIVTWCVGHLAGLADAAAYDPSYAKWRWSDLPIIPENWRFTLDKSKTDQFAIVHAFALYVKNLLLYFFRRGVIIAIPPSCCGVRVGPCIVLWSAVMQGAFFIR